MKNSISTSLLALLVLAHVGCSKSSDTAATNTTSADALKAALSAAAAVPAPTPAAAAGPKVITLTALGLKGTAPGETEEPIMGNTDPVLVMAGQFALTVSAAKASDPKTLKEGQEEAKMYNPKNIKTETLSDGWAMTFENTGSAGTNYMVSARREIGGKGYRCETSQNNVDQQKRALDFCKSLTK